MSFLLVRPYADMTLPDSQSLLFRAHTVTIQSGENIVSVYKNTLPIVVFVLATGILSFITIFLYHRRLLQIRLTMLNMVMIVALIGIMFAYYTTVQNDFTGEKSNFRVGMAFPLLSLLFCAMAIRAVRHDEVLVKSYDRIR
jgi:glucan phosphoethanolaminetransferase (alkaline phosphatase superfamily)